MIPQCLSNILQNYHKELRFIFIYYDFYHYSFFLEKNMLSYFLHIMRQKSGGSSFVCVQLLQTLNILFENIRNETSLCTFFYREAKLALKSDKACFVY